MQGTEDPASAFIPVPAPLRLLVYPCEVPVSPFQCAPCYVEAVIVPPRNPDLKTSKPFVVSLSIYFAREEITEDTKSPLEAVNTSKALEVLEKGSCVMGGVFREVDFGRDIPYELQQEKATVRDRLSHSINIY